jgi:hypothetical protein
VASGRAHLSVPDRGSLALAQVVVLAEAAQKRAARSHLEALLARPKEPSTLVLQPLAHHLQQELAQVMQPRQYQKIVLLAVLQSADRGEAVAGYEWLAEQVGAHLAPE